MKRIWRWLLAVIIIMVMAFPSTSYAASTQGLPLRIVVDGEKINMNQGEAYMDESDIVFVPISFFKESLGLKISQNDLQASIAKGNSKLIFAVGGQAYELNGSKKQFEATTIFKEGTLFVQLKGACEALRIPYRWDSDVNTSYIDLLEQREQQAGGASKPEVSPPVTLPKQGAVPASVSRQQSQFNGNIANFGDVASTDRYHFYVRQISSNEEALYRYDPKTKQTKQLTKGRTIYNLVAVGEWLYYLGDNPDKSFYQAYALYKIKLDGTKKALVLKKNDLTRFFSIDKGWLYFGNWQDNGELYRMKLDGSQLKKLANVEANQINIWGSWLVFDSGNDIYIYSTDGKELAEIPLRGRFVTVSEGHLYVSGFNGEITKIPLKAGVLQQEVFYMKPVLSYKSYGDIQAINYKNNTAYMYIEESNQITKMRMDGTKPTAFVKLPKNGNVQDILIAGNDMYYTVIYTVNNHKITKRELYRIPLEGSRKPVQIYSVKVS